MIRNGGLTWIGTLASLDRNMQAVATPDTTNSSDIRHGLVSSISGSNVGPACGLLTCQSQLT